MEAASSAEASDEFLGLSQTTREISRQVVLTFYDHRIYRVDLKLLTIHVIKNNAGCLKISDIQIQEIFDVEDQKPAGAISLAITSTILDRLTDFVGNLSEEELSLQLEYVECKKIWP